MHMAHELRMGHSCESGDNLTGPLPQEHDAVRKFEGNEAHATNTGT
jgi:hypothetical protein